jgi:hypothetical protein
MADFTSDLITDGILHRASAHGLPCTCNAAWRSTYRSMCAFLHIGVKAERTHRCAL